MPIKRKTITNPRMSNNFIHIRNKQIITDAKQMGNPTISTCTLAHSMQQFPESFFINRLLQFTSPSSSSTPFELIRKRQP